MPLYPARQPLYVNAMDYGAAPGNAASVNDTAFAAVIALIAAAGGGCMLIPGGRFATGGLTLTLRTDVSILGTGTGTVLVPTAGSTGITYAQCTRCHLGNLRIDGSTNVAAIGISITGNLDAKLWNLHINDCSGDGVFVNGDDAAGVEIEIYDLTCRNNGGYGYHYSRTTTNDRGGMYLVNYRSLYNTQGTGGIKIESTQAQTPAFHTIHGASCDNYPATPTSLHNVTHVRFTSLWTACSGTASPQSILIDGTGFMIIINGAYMLNNNTAGYNIVIANTISNVLMDNLQLDGAALAHFHITSSGTGFYIGQYIIFGSSPLTDTFPALFARVAPVGVGPLLIETDSSGGSSQTLGFDDVRNVGKQKWLRNNNGNLQIINTAFSQTVLESRDNGDCLISGSIASGQSATAPDPTTGGTVVTSHIGVARITPAAAETGGILAVGTLAGQEVWVINESATNQFSWATQATSHIAGEVGGTFPLAANRAQKFVWDSSTSLWYKAS